MKGRLLFVDDNPGITGTLQRLFRKTGYKVNIANSGKEALEIMGLFQFDVIISDQKMPIMSGRFLLELASKKQPNAVKFLFTGYPILPNEINTKAKIIIDKVIRKPCFDDELIEHIDNAMICAHPLRQQSNRTTVTQVVE